jgi:hypothetical protein
MKRAITLCAVAVMLVLVAWSAGRAQSRMADFYVTVDAPTGEIRATCSRGCDWPATPGEPSSAIVYRCQSQPCRLVFDARGRVIVGKDDRQTR